MPLRFVAIEAFGTESLLQAMHSVWLKCLKLYKDVVKVT